MDCNKDDAIKAKDIAERKMESKDFANAKKFILKAQQLLPELENISQMLAVCEVHCSFGIKVNGHTDWYGILQLEQASDESSIKKQYRKLALLLHPDKNKFAGAEAAFKLIGEAHMTLSDPSKRSDYDMRRKSKLMPNPPPNKTWATNVWNQAPNNTTVHANGMNQQQSSFAVTFWTVCPSCKITYQYHLSILNKPIRCQRCLMPFVAYDRNAPAAPHGLHSEPPKQQFPSKGSSNTAFQGNLGGGPPASQPPSTKHCGRSTDKTKEDGNGAGAGANVKSEEVKKKEKTVKPSSGNTSRKRGRKIAESSDGETSIEEKEQNAGVTGSYCPRRSAREKKDIAYNEDVEDVIDDEEGFVSPSCKRKHEDGSSGETIDAKLQTSKTVPDEKMEDLNHKTDASRSPNGSKPVAGEKEEAKADSSSKTSPNLDTFSYPDPEFYDFDKDKDASRFAIGQIWAMYDTLDGMPRFYARIKSVTVPRFNARFTWLEHYPKNKVEEKWTDEELPVACGRYKHGKTESTKDRLMFSHLMSFEEGTRKYSYNIYPKKGEVWALFKGWDISWSADPDSHRLYEYEVVEVVLDLTEGADVSVIPLVRIKGFVCLFARSIHTLSIPSAEALRFSHKVPSYRLTGNERGGVPQGSFELDPASLPNKFEEVFPAVDMHDEFKDIPGTDNPSAPESPCGVFGSDFYDFSNERSIDNFQAGQIWALYCEEYKYPNCYGLIIDVEPEKQRVRVKSLEACSPKKEIKRWLKARLPVACGEFDFSKTEVTFDTTDGFSHLVHAEPSKRRGRHDIWPNVNEIWAIYKKWNVGWERADLDECGYDVVEVIEQTGSLVKALILKKVNGYKAVFMPESRVVGKIEILMEECLRFSHRIPAFRLTEERGGKLRGFWELDSDSVPETLLFVNVD